MDKKIKFIMVGKDDNFSFSDDSINKFYEDHPNYKDIVRFHKIPNNKEKLTTVYNNELKIERESRVDDFLVFMHADVSLDFDHLIKHMIDCESKYDIIGLCGCQKIKISQSPLNWFTGSIPNPQYRWGCVTHGEQGNRKSFFSYDRKDITDSPVACIDGLCIIFTRKAIDSEILFDETFSFDLYDTDISFQCLLKYDLKLGVIVEESLQHYSVGKSILTKEFLAHELDFRKKWNLEIPKDSPINNLINNDEEVKII